MSKTWQNFWETLDFHDYFRRDQIQTHNYAPVSYNSVTSVEYMDE